MIFFGIFTALIIFTLIVVVHEYGHFKSARLFGVKIEEFGIGIPPRAKKLFTDKKGTLFSLNWLPIGGFVKIHGESAESIEDKKDPQAFVNKPVWQQSIILLAGVFMNFLLAGIIFSALFFVGIKPVGINTYIPTNTPIKLIPNTQQALESGILEKNPGIIVNPIENSLAEKSGLQPGEIITHINNSPLNSLQNFQEILKRNSGKTINIQTSFLETKDTKKILQISPEGKIGAYIGENIQVNNDFEYKYGFLKSLQYGFQETYYQTLLTFKGLGMLLKNIFTPETKEIQKETLQSISGPIGIVDIITQSLSGGLKYLLILAAIISINLGVFNLLPIPALDGGRFLFVLINGLGTKIFGKKFLKAHIENYIHVFFFLLLIALSVIIAYNDISKILMR